MMSPKRRGAGSSGSDGVEAASPVDDVADFSDQDSGPRHLLPPPVSAERGASDAWAGKALGAPSRAATAGSWVERLAACVAAEKQRQPSPGKPGPLTPESSRRKRPRLARRRPAGHIWTARSLRTARQVVQFMERPKADASQGAPPDGC